jgi:hypothetical protein
MLSFLPFRRERSRLTLRAQDWAGALDAVAEAHQRQPRAAPQAGSWDSRRARGRSHGVARLPLGTRDHVRVCVDGKFGSQIGMHQQHEDVLSLDGAAGRRRCSLTESP